MNLNKLLPLTETTFYIMLALLKPSHGYAVMQTVEMLSGHKVKVAAGTLYGAIENLMNQKLIQEVQSNDRRRRVYVLTESGRELLKLDVARIKHMASSAENLFRGEEKVL